MELSETKVPEAESVSMALQLHIYGLFNGLFWSVVIKFSVCATNDVWQTNEDKGDRQVAQEFLVSKNNYNRLEEQL